MRVVVTGASGFLGSTLVPALAGAGFDVVEIGGRGGTSDAAVAKRYAWDVCTGNGLVDAFHGVDAVVHLAARNHVLRETAKDPLAEYRRVNVEGTRNVVRAACDAGAKYFVHASSVKAMGEGGEEILDESSPCRPSTPYGISKLESEIVVAEEAAKGGMKAVVLRFPMVYGPGNRGNLPRLIRWADRGLPFPLLHPENLRSMLYAENAAAAVIAVLASLASGKTRGGTYFVKDEEDLSAQTLYLSICRALGKSPRFVPVPSALSRLAGAVSEDFRKVTSSFRVSSAKLREEIGFVPPVSAQEGIERTVQWYKRSAR